MATGRHWQQLICIGEYFNIDADVCVQFKFFPNLISLPLFHIESRLKPIRAARDRSQQQQQQQQQQQPPPQKKNEKKMIRKNWYWINFQTKTEKREERGKWPKRTRNLRKNVMMNFLSCDVSNNMKSFSGLLGRGNNISHPNWLLFPRFSGTHQANRWEPMGGLSTPSSDSGWKQQWAPGC